MLLERSALGNFDCDPVERDHPIVVALLAKFLAKFGLPEDLRSAGQTFFMLSRDGEPALVLGLALRNDGGLEATDFYSLPTRAGLEATYQVLRVFKALVEAKRIPYVVVAVLARNHAMRRRIERVYGVKEVTVVYTYPKNA